MMPQNQQPVPTPATNSALQTITVGFSAPPHHGVANSAHPLHGLSAAERAESRQRVFAKALAELLRGRTAVSSIPSSSGRP
jgi:hypothetical protein